MTDQKNKADNTLRPLSEVAAGHMVRLLRIEAGGGLKSRLAAMGLISNAPISVIRNDSAGQIIIAVRGTKVILGRGMSQKILVR